MRLEQRMKALEARLSQRQRPPEKASLALPEGMREEVIGILLDAGVLSREETQDNEEVECRP